MTNGLCMETVEQHSEQQDQASSVEISQKKTKQEHYVKSKA